MATATATATAIGPDPTAESLRPTAYVAGCEPGLRGSARNDGGGMATATAIAGSAPGGHLEVATATAFDPTAESLPPTAYVAGCEPGLPGSARNTLQLAQAPSDADPPAFVPVKMLAQLASLKATLQQAVAAADYSRAAMLQDEVGALQTRVDDAIKQVACATADIEALKTQMAEAAAAADYARAAELQDKMEALQATVDLIQAGDGLAVETAATPQPDMMDATAMTAPPPSAEPHAYKSAPTLPPAYKSGGSTPRAMAPPSYGSASPPAYGAQQAPPAYGATAPSYNYQPSAPPAY